MRVMCIKSPVNPEYAVKDLPAPSVGDIDTVVGEVEKYGYLFYALEGYSEKSGFLARNFTTLPDEPAEVIEESIEEPELQTV